MNKKAQVFGQVFVLIIAAIVFLLIIFYGYRAITGFTERSEQVALVEFETELESSVKQIAIDYGSVKKLELSLPGKYKQVCFVDLDKVPELPPNNALSENYPLVWDSVTSGSPQNVFLIPPSDMPITVEKMTITARFFCLTVVDGKIALRLRGLGASTEISEWPRE